MSLPQGEREPDRWISLTYDFQFDFFFNQLHFLWRWSCKKKSTHKAKKR